MQETFEKRLFMPLYPNTTRYMLVEYGSSDWAMEVLRDHEVYSAQLLFTEGKLNHAIQFLERVGDGSPSAGDLHAGLPDDNAESANGQGADGEMLLLPLLLDLKANLGRYLDSLVEMFSIKLYTLDAREIRRPRGPGRPATLG